MCPHTTIYVCVLMLIGMCPHTTIYLYICPHTTISTCVSSSYYISIRVLILPYTCMCPHTSAILQSRLYSPDTALILLLIFITHILLYIYVSSYYYICMCSHTALILLLIFTTHIYYSNCSRGSTRPTLCSTFTCAIWNPTAYAGRAEHLLRSLRSIKALLRLC